MSYSGSYGDTSYSSYGGGATSGGPINNNNGSTAASSYDYGAYAAGTAGIDKNGSDAAGLRRRAGGGLVGHPTAMVVDMATITMVIVTVKIRRIVRSSKS